VFSAGITEAKLMKTRRFLIKITEKLFEKDIFAEMQKSRL
jgi:hypothetical protein